MEPTTVRLTGKRNDDEGGAVSLGLLTMEARYPSFILGFPARVRGRPWRAFAVVRPRDVARLTYADNQPRLELQPSGGLSAPRD